eukprot:1011573_1
MQKRYIGLSILSCCLSILWIFCGVSMFILHCLLREESPIPLPLPVRVSVAISSLYPILGQCIIYTLLIRFFMLFFHLNWTRATLLSHWILHIRKLQYRQLKRFLELQQQEQHPLHLVPTHSGHFHSVPLINTSQSNALSENKTPEIHDRIAFPEELVHFHNSWYINNRAKFVSHKHLFRYVYPVFVIELSVVISISVMEAYSTSSNCIWTNLKHIANSILWLIPGVLSFY